MWKYNLRAHIIAIHHPEDIKIYEHLFAFQKDEIVLMKRVFLTVPRRKKVKNGANTMDMVIAEGTSSSSVFM